METNQKREAKPRAAKYEKQRREKNGKTNHKGQRKPLKSQTTKSKKKREEIQVEKAKLKPNEHKDNLPGLGQAFLPMLFKLLNELTTLFTGLEFPLTA